MLKLFANVFKLLAKISNFSLNVQTLLNCWPTFALEGTPRKGWEEPGTDLHDCPPAAPMGLLND